MSRGYTIGVDPALYSCGVAVLNNETKKIVRVASGNVFSCVSMLELWIVELNDPLVVVERLAGKNVPARFKSTQALASAIVDHLQRFAKASVQGGGNRIDVVTVSPDEWRKGLLGHRNAGKDADKDHMKRLVKMYVKGGLLHPAIKDVNFDEADACAVAMFGSISKGHLG